jgi:hypothetical protein
MLGIGGRPWEESDSITAGAIEPKAITQQGLELLRRNLNFAIGEGAMTGNRIDDWEQTALQYGYATRDRPPDVLITDLAADLAELRQALSECRSSSTLRRLTRLTAQMAGLVML